MLYLESFVHRDALAEIISRWMVDHPLPGDVERLKTIVNFNSYVSRIWTDRLTKDIIKSFTGMEPRRLVVRTKGQLKDFVVAHPRYTSERIEEMLSRYGKFPEDFYRETPIDGAMYVNDLGGALQFVGSSRIKRFRRVAEKGSRRIVDYMLARIRANADALAEERAKSLGIPKDRLLTPPEQMVEEFNHAERRLIKSIKQGTIQSELPPLSIPDVAGIKLIAEPDEYVRLFDILQSSPWCTVLEEEKHSGNYKGTNLRVSYLLPKEMLEAMPPSGGYLKVLDFRGFDAHMVADQYREFIRAAEERVRLEIIVSDFQEFLESEIGRSMHEERVLSQRSHRDYNGHLATNIRYLMDFILSLCRAPSQKDLEEVPIKLWVKYMPDTIERSVRNLYIPDDYFFDTVPVQSMQAAPDRTIDA
ncbi:MAG: hypothetical protein PHU25_21905 [Deltaproteobacteria bacterium]|nr:hypothetical protein [Deltaproteobacteria bacterium]